MYIADLNIGFLELPNKVSLNIFAVGCKHNCDGCHSKNLTDFDFPGRYVLEKENLCRKIEENISFIDGITFLGGDPIFQKTSLLDLCKVIKTKFKDKLIGIFTGFKFEDLDPELKEYVDLIKDGKWEGIPITDEKSNQRIFIKQDNRWNQVTYNQLFNILK